MRNGVDEEGFFRFTGNNGGAGIAAALPTGTGVKIEIGFEFLGIGRVALVAMLGEQRPNMGFEILEARGLICPSQLSGNDHHKKNHDRGCREFF